MTAPAPMHTCSCPKAGRSPEFTIPLHVEQYAELGFDWAFRCDTCGSVLEFCGGCEEDRGQDQ